MPFIKTTDGTNIFYNDWGAGRPVVLIHGWPLSSASWEYQSRVLAEDGFRVIAYDRRGFGKSDQPFNGYDYNTFASDLNDLMTELDLQGAALVGFSMGGGEVARYLKKYGASRTDRAVLVSAVTPYMLKTSDNPEGVDQKVFDEMIANIQKDRPAFMKQFAPQFYGRTMVNHTVSEEQLEFFVAIAMQASPRATLECVKAFSATDFRKDIAEISVPTLIIHGTSDKTVPIDVSGRRAAKLIPNAQTIEYDGEAHGLNVSAPDKFNSDLLAFLRSSATA